VWIWWSQVALSFAAEVRAAWRGRSARSLPLRALGAQPIVVRLVAIVVAAAATVGTVAHPAVAATPSFAEITVPMNAGRSSGGQPGGTTSAVPHTAVAGTLAAVDGSRPAPILGLPATAVVEVDPVAPAPVLGTPVPAIGDESQPQQPPSQPAPSGERSTSLRWDPVLTPEVAAPVERAPGSPAVSASAAGPVASPFAPPVASEVAGAVSVPFGRPDAPEWVVVKPGDSLWLLAERHLGDALRWADIFDLNVGQLEGGGTLRDPNLIHPGWRLRLPPADSPEGPDHPDQRGPASPAAAVAASAPAVPAQPASR